MRRADAIRKSRLRQRSIVLLVAALGTSSWGCERPATPDGSPASGEQEGVPLAIETAPRLNTGKAGGPPGDELLPYDPMKHAQALGGWRGSGPGGRWVIFAPSGERVADLELPPLLFPSQITRDSVVGIERDPQLGVESVAVYRLTRR